MKNPLLFFLLVVYSPFHMALNENLLSRKPDLQEGVYAAVLTPMHSDFTCNHRKLASHCFELIQQGCTGVALFGTTGEGPSFSLSERVEALENLILIGNFF